jgi:deoxyribonuclease V
VSSYVRCSEDVDLVGLILETVRQVPSGRVTTYGDVAKALGDVRAARAVAEVLSHPDFGESPRHRVVNLDGEVGSGVLGPIPSAKLLQKENVAIKNGRVEGLDKFRFTDFEVPPVLDVLKIEQEALRSHVIESDDFDKSSLVAGLDVSYSNDKACGALVRMDPESLEVMEVRHAIGRVRFPYVPGYLSYRELPMVRKVCRETDGDILLIDGQGVLHPRGFGIACQIGVCFNVPTIGAAKSLLTGTVVGLGQRDEILVDGMVRGMRLRPKRGKGVFVSVGHRVSLNTACALCERLMIKEVPEPLRLAHILATRERKAMELEE